MHDDSAENPPFAYLLDRGRRALHALAVLLALGFGNPATAAPMLFDVDISLDFPALTFIDAPYTFDRIHGTMTADPLTIPSTNVVDCFGDGANPCEVSSMSLVMSLGGAPVGTMELAIANTLDAIFIGTFVGGGGPVPILLEVNNLVYEIGPMGDCTAGPDQLCFLGDWTFSGPGGPFLFFAHFSSAPGDSAPLTYWETNGASNCEAGLQEQVPPGQVPPAQSVGCGTFDVNVHVPAPAPLALFGVGLLALVVAPKRRAT
ncbi:MAG: hypothetical protein KDG50_14625 [Chromatiales bacterium]|nr:hypothetical protein [Chromatiales bacterium]